VANGVGGDPKLRDSGVTVIPHLRRHSFQAVRSALLAIDPKTAGDAQRLELRAAIRGARIESGGTASTRCWGEQAVLSAGGEWGTGHAGQRIPSGGVTPACASGSVRFVPDNIDRRVDRCRHHQWRRNAELA